MASRICVKNLPKDCEEQQLRKYFERFGPFTDVKIMRTGEGVSRGFGFLGFVNPSNAMNAVQYFNKSFMGTRRLIVEPAHKVGDACLSRPWSKYSKGSSSYQERHLAEGHRSTVKTRDRLDERRRAVDDGEEEDEELKEFLNLMMPSKDIAGWDDDIASEQKKKKENHNKRKRDSEELGNETAEADPAATPPESGIRRLFVRNLSYTATESDLVETFTPYGELIEVHIVTDMTTKKSKGFAFIEFEDASCASAAMEELDGSIFQGRLIHILPSYDKRQKHPSSNPRATEDAGSSFKREKEAKLKEQAGNRSAWNTFYMRSDTITEAVADYYQVSKSELMNRDASDLGVRLALGETHVLSKTKEELESAGVDVSKLEEAAQASGKAASEKTIRRCNDCIILKNLPYHSNEQELLDMFGEYGEVLKFVMPATHVMAIVRFVEAVDAKKAFRSLAYKKYKSVPIYLEWAPLDIFANAPVRLGDAHGSGEEDNVEEESTGVCLYVKNLSFATKDSDLAKHFDMTASEVGGQLRSARVARRMHSDGTIVSAGFGFVELNSEEVAKHVMHKLQKSVLDGHILQLRRSLKKSQSSTKKAPDDDVASTKLIVKNLAFECTRQDVMHLFAPFGHVRSCRLPKKFDGQHRGFAFLDFVTKDEAKTAMVKVSGAHLYGRRLGIQFAKEDASSTK